MSDEEDTQRKTKKQKTSASGSSSKSSKQDNKDTTPPASSIFPIARVQKIIKLDNDVNKITAEAVFLISKSTEFFVEFMVAESYKQTKRDGKRKTIQYKDIAKTVQDLEAMEFLYDSIPEKQSGTKKP